VFTKELVVSSGALRIYMIGFSIADRAISLILISDSGCYDVGSCSLGLNVSLANV
jgi:hypothetical protein